MSDDKALDSMFDAMMAAAGPSQGKKKEVTYAEFQAMLDSTPLFMRETPKDGAADGEGNDVLEALKSLVFEGEGDEVAGNFKNHGNELYAQKSYRDAVDAYTSGIDAGPVDPELRISLLNNRAASNLALKNYGAVLRDAGLIIALCTNPAEGERRAVPPKAMYRAAQALVALERWKEAGDVVARGRELPGEEGNKVWSELSGKVDKGRRSVAERMERIRREKLSKDSLKRAVESRGLVVVNTSSPPDNPHPLHFDPDSLPIDPPLYQPDASPDDLWQAPDPSTPLVIPTFLLYPAHSQSDLITHFNENTSLDDQLAAMFPSSASSSSPPWADWDTAREYWTGNLAVYVETAARRLLKVGKEITLREVIAKAVKVGEDGKKDGVVLRDGLLSFVVLVKGQQEKAWIEQYKQTRDGSNSKR
ncbi:hypothetical protein JCM24511_00466 [Saitozyma sp. JCM 24511]|nr:hypothetical protein JCM24511_00466 [Saitozyma sp. JCM 24511]